MMGFDDTALRTPVDPVLAKSERRERALSDGRRVDRVLGWTWGVFQTVVLVGGFGVLAALAVVTVQYLFGASDADLTTVVIAGLMVTPLAIARIRSHMRGPGELDITEYRLTRFARTNDLSYRTDEAGPVRAAAILNAGGSRIATDIVAGDLPRPFEAANYSFDTWAARTRFPRSANYVSFELRTQLPEMNLVTKAPVATSGWTPKASRQRVQIDDDFSARFDVFAEPTTAEAARRLFTPDVQSAVLSLAEKCDIEITRDHVFITARRHLPMTDTAYWEWVADLADLVALLETHDQPDVSSHSPEPDVARRTRREALFAPIKDGHVLVLGCLAPLLIGLTAAAIITKAFTG